MKKTTITSINRQTVTKFRFSIKSQSSTSRTTLICVFFKSTPTTAIYTLSLHDALPIFLTNLDLLLATSLTEILVSERFSHFEREVRLAASILLFGDRKSTRLNSSHTVISYAVFCSKKTNVSI